MIKVTIEDKDGNIKLCKSNPSFLAISYKSEYFPGDVIRLEADYPATKDTEEPVILKVQLEDSLQPTFIRLTGKEFVFTVPSGDLKRVYSEKSFTGGMHYLRVELANPLEYYQYHNLVLNPLLQDSNIDQVLPNVVPSNKAGNIRFAARNLVNGVAETNAHGSYPFGSWSTGASEVASLRFNFASPVSHLSHVVLHTRADFPHDNFIRQVTVVPVLKHAGLDVAIPSTEHNFVFDLTRTGLPQVLKLDFEYKNQSAVIVGLIIKDPLMGDGATNFTAISEVEVYGKPKVPFICPAGSKNVYQDVVKVISPKKPS